MTTETNTQEIINTNLQDALSVFIDKTVEGVDASVEFLQQEIPDVIYQLILWYGVKSATTALLIILLLTVVHYGIYRGVKLASSLYAEHHKKDAYSITVVMAGVGTLIAYPLLWIETLSPLYNNLMTALQIWVAPKIWLLEYAGSFIK